ncbi:TetR/AcrR family transcriptional regulator C-terminal domain-containing protein [Dactylosporangium sp. CA-052675]|uniref:TetR/AcrR family transcriptional regulator C-terminal domain-containing protein n=1 Tax=Dactylosporangium sp. CA-052675 TaxID=3239927 RepID=UPI003D944BBC
MLGHRDVARLIAGYARCCRHHCAWGETYLRLAAEGRLSPQAAFGGDTLMAYVTGFVLQEQSTHRRPIHSIWRTCGASCPGSRNRTPSGRLTRPRRSGPASTA